MSDWTLLPVAGLGLFGLLGVAEVLRGMGVDTDHTRRFVHSSVALAVVGFPLVFRDPLPVYVLALLFVGVNFVARSARWWRSIHEARARSWGTVTMPLALIIGLAGTWSVAADRIVIFQAAFSVLAIADPLAAWTGQRYGGGSFQSGATVLGSTVFFGGAVVILGGVLLGIGEWSMLRACGTAVLAAGTVTVVEGVSRWGLDNLGIVLAVLLILVPLYDGTATIGDLLAAGGAGVVFGVATYWMRSLTGVGAVAGGLFAASLVGLGGTMWVVPGLAFFVLSSALSVLPNGEEAAMGEQENEGRTLRQVLANGGVAWALLAVGTLASTSAPALQTGCYLGFLGALAAAAADTWATELGTRYAVGRPWSLCSLRPVPSGRSGAVSFVGTVGALLGATSIVGAAYVGGAPVIAVGHAVQIVGGGVLGMMVDSLLGATVQARYRDPGSQTLVERPVEPEATPSWGWAGVDNEVVNLCGTAAGAIGSVGMFLLGGGL